MSKIGGIFIIKKVLIYTVSIIFSLFLINQIYWGYTNHVLFHFTPLVQHLPDKSNVKYVYARNVKDPDRYTLLTDDPATIDALLNDLKWTWHTNFSSLPSGEPELELIFDDDRDPVAHNGYIKFYPQSDKLAFYGNADWFVSLDSSGSVKKLLEHHDQLIRSTK